LKIERAADIEPAITSVRGPAEALYIVTGSFVSTHRVEISTLALAAKLSAISAIKEFAAAGALISYGAHYPDQNRRAAELVDKILKGARPADLPVEQPTRFELVINLNTAKALGLTMPPLLLVREVIE
jgi:putative ABC transport system substrate-binding protein